MSSGKALEVASYVDVSQFERLESVRECGFFGVALNAGAGKPGEKPLRDAEWIDERADAWYVDVTGLANTPSNKNGMSLLELYYTLHFLAGLHWQACKKELDYIRGYIRHGYPVIVAVDEKSCYDIGLGDRVPYSWKPTGSHIITLSGIVGDNFLVHDPANVDEHGPRPGPRIYDAGKLSLVSATAVVLPWLERPPVGFDPRVEPDPAQSPILSDTYTIRPGDTLSAIAAIHGTTIAKILDMNLEKLDEVARQENYRSSNNGEWIFPGTTIRIQ